MGTGFMSPDTHLPHWACHRNLHQTSASWGMEFKGVFSFFSLHMYPVCCHRCCFCIKHTWRNQLHAGMAQFPRMGELNNPQLQKALSYNAITLLLILQQGIKPTGANCSHRACLTASLEWPAELSWSAPELLSLLVDRWSTELTSLWRVQGHSKPLPLFNLFCSYPSSLHMQPL